MKLLVVSAWAPPMGGGSPIVLARRLGALPRGSYSILTSERRAFETGSGTEWLAAKYHFLGEETAEPSRPQHSPLHGRGQRAYIDFRVSAFTDMTHLHQFRSRIWTTPFTDMTHPAPS